MEWYLVKKQPPENTARMTDLLSSLSELTFTAAHSGRFICRVCVHEPISNIWFTSIKRAKSATAYNQCFCCCSTETCNSVWGVGGKHTYSLLFYTIVENMVSLLKDKSPIRV